MSFTFVPLKRKFIVESYNYAQLGSVYLARVKSTKHIAAIKVMFKAQVEEHDILHQIKREVEIQSRIKHPHVLKLRGFFADEKRVYMVMEYAKHGSMYDILKRNGPLEEDKARRYAYPADYGFFVFVSWLNFCLFVPDFLFCLMWREMYAIPTVDLCWWLPQVCATTRVGPLPAAAPPHYPPRFEAGKHYGR